jgi:hypothetical protein
MFSLLSLTLSQIAEQVFEAYGVKQYNFGLYHLPGVPSTWRFKTNVTLQIKGT